VVSLAGFAVCVDNGADFRQGDRISLREGVRTVLESGGHANGAEGPGERGERRGSYRGPDRRSAVSPTGPDTRQLAVAVALLVATSACFTVLSLTRARSLDAELRALNGVLWTVCTVFALVLGVASALRWRVIGDASSLRVATAFLLLTVLVIVVDLVPFVDGDARPHGWVARLGVAMSIAVAISFAAAVVLRPIDAGLSISRHLIEVAAMVVVFLACVSFVPSLDHLATWRHSTVHGAGGVASRTAVVVVWALLGLIASARGIRRSSSLWAWLGVMFFGFACADVLASTATPDDEVWLTGALVVRAMALFFGLAGVCRQLVQTYVDQQTRAYVWRLSLETDAVRRRAEQAESEERAHEVRSALLAIESAARRLEPRDEELGAFPRATLGNAIEGEVELVRQLVERDRQPTGLAAFDVGTAIMPLVTLQRAAGRNIEIDLKQGLRAIGRRNEVSEVLHVLLDNAREHAAMSSVRVRTERVGTRVQIRVEDRGPGVPTPNRELIFLRGVTTAVQGSGLGLHVARQLMREQGGDVWVEDRIGGGASFVVSLPADLPVARPVKLRGDSEPRRQFQRFPAE
jgi:signal transduction histidine kinase